MDDVHMQQHDNWSGVGGVSTSTLCWTILLTITLFAGLKLSVCPRSSGCRARNSKAWLMHVPKTLLSLLCKEKQLPSGLSEARSRGWKPLGRCFPR